MEWLDYSFFDNSVQDYLVFAGLVIGSWLLAWLVGWLLKRFVIGRAEKTGSRLDDLLEGVGVRPLSLIVFLAGLRVACGSLVLPKWLDKVLMTGFMVAWTMLGAVFVSRLLKGLLIHYIQRFAEKSEEALLAQMVNMVRSAVGVVVWIVAGLFLVANLGFDVSSLLAGLGLGGLALAMASKDTLSNVFGSFTILVNGPYAVGELVTYMGHSGTVEVIGMRDTRIRRFDGNLVTVPNSLAPTSVIENISRRPSFRVLFKLGLVYDTPAEKIDRAIELVKQAVQAEEGTGEKILTHFIGFADSALEIQVIYYIEDTDRILDAQHGVNRRIRESFEKAGIEFAYPTVTVEGPGAKMAA